MSNNKNMNKAKNVKDDEFYTQLDDIANELKNYKDKFKDKIVYCNCDNPEWSNFWLYFKLNFEHLELKKLISTHYNDKTNSYKLEMYKVDNDISEVKTILKCNGDFRSPECIDILKESDIVVTNPPFSLFKEYMSQLIENNKSFLVIGNTNAITYNEVFPEILKGNMWLGVSPRSMTFIRPDGSKEKVNACWFTNLDHNKRHERFIPYMTYKGNETNYSKFDDEDVLNVDKAKDIPSDYNGVMAVPITFLEKLNPEQFKIVGKNNSPKINGKTIYKRLLIKWKNGEN